MLQGAQLVVDQQVALVEDDGGGDVVGVGGDQQAVDEARRGARQAEGRHDAEEVDIGGDDVGLFAELGGAADDVIAAVAHLVDDAGAVVLQFKEHAVAHSHGVCLPVAPQAVVAPQTAVNAPLAVLHQHFVPASCSSYDKTFHHKSNCKNTIILPHSQKFY